MVLSTLLRILQGSPRRYQISGCGCHSLSCFPYLHKVAEVIRRYLSTLQMDVGNLGKGCRRPSSCNVYASRLRETFDPRLLVS